MKKTVLASLAALAILFALPASCHAHSVHPAFIGVGPIAVLAAMQSVVGWAALLAVIAGQALILRSCIPGASFLGGLWRAAAVFVLSRLAEIVPLFICPDAIMGQCSDSMLVLIVAMILVEGVVVTVLLVGLLCYRMRPGRLRVLGLALAMECSSVLGLFLTNLAMLEAGLIR